MIHAALIDRWVVLTNQHRGVRFGRLLAYDAQTKTALLADAQAIYTWATPAGADKGIVSLATVGPQAGSRVGPRVELALCDAVSTLWAATDVAKTQWQTVGWSR